MKHWLVKQEPTAYSWDRFAADGKTQWTGVRNFTARINLRAMRPGDLCLYYHSVTGKCVMGAARVVSQPYPDPTAREGDWTAVDLEPVFRLRNAVTIEQIKSDPRLAGMAFLKQSRLSVSPVTKDEYERVVKLGGREAV